MSNKMDEIIVGMFGGVRNAYVVSFKNRGNSAEIFNFAINAML